MVQGFTLDAGNPDLAFGSIGPYSCFSEKGILKKFPECNTDLHLLHQQGLLCQCQACQLSSRISVRLNGVTKLI